MQNKLLAARGPLAGCAHNEQLDTPFEEENNITTPTEAVEGKQTPFCEKPLEPLN
jgi:hypothetical protein